MAYHVVLEPFEGPLDLLLYLISNAQIDIRDIRVSQITEQYLSYVSLMREMDMDRSSQFLAMAARLLEIKSRRLLPRARDEEEGTVQDDEQLLIEQLEMYRQYKQACEQLREREKEAGLLYYKKPGEMYLEAEYDFSNASVTALCRALQEVLRKRQAGEEDPGDEGGQAIERDAFTIQERIFYIRGRLAAGESLSFGALFPGRAGRQEVVITFIALLELLRLGRVSVVQRHHSEEILITQRGQATLSQS